MSNVALHPPLKWAQRKSSLYFTIAVSDLKVETLELTEKKLVFKGTSDEGGETKTYALEFDFFADVDPKAEGSVWNVRPREAHFHIMKKDQEAEYWPRLTNNKAAEKKQPITVDWSRYTDEDEEEEGGFDTQAMGGGMNFADMMGGGGAGGMPGMGGMGGMPGMGGMGGMPGMGGMGGAGGPGGMDLSALMAQMGGAGGMGGMPDLSALGGAGLGDEGDSDDEADLPDLEGTGAPGNDSPADGAQATGGN